MRIDLPALHSGCLLCGDDNQRSLRLRFQSIAGGAVEARFQGNPDFQGYTGILHGGVISALLDAGMTHCLFRQGIQAVTADLHVRFVHPVSCGDELQIRAWLVSRDPPLYRLKSVVTAMGQTMAWAEAKFIERRDA